MNSELKTPNSEISQIKRLFDKTQNNIRRIQQYGGEFYYPVLNEWRFVTEYAIFALESPDQRMTILPLLKGRLLKAYYDSCLILADCCLEELIYKISRIRRAARTQKGLRNVFENAVSEFRNLQSIRLGIEESGEPDEAQINNLISAVARLKPVFDSIKANEDLVRWILRKRRVIIKIAFLAGIIELLIGIGFVFARLWR